MALDEDLGTVGGAFSYGDNVAAGSDVGVGETLLYHHLGEGLGSVLFLPAGGFYDDQLLEFLFGPLLIVFDEFQGLLDLFVRQQFIE